MEALENLKRWNVHKLTYKTVVDPIKITLSIHSGSQCHLWLFYITRFEPGTLNIVVSLV